MDENIAGRNRSLPLGVTLGYHQSSNCCWHATGQGSYGGTGLSRGHWREGRSWYEELLALQEEIEAPADPVEIVSAELKARLLYCTGTLAFRQNDWKSAMAYGEKSLSLAQSVNNLAEQSRACPLVSP